MGGDEKRERGWKEREGRGREGGEGEELEGFGPQGELLDPLVPIVKLHFQNGQLQ